MSAAGEFPKWALLEPFVFRRDDEDSFPDESKAPIWASGTTSWGAAFNVAFSLGEPPCISRLYAQLPVPGFLDPKVGDPLAILATHRNLALLRVATETPPGRGLTVQDFFVFNASGENSSLKLLPTCNEPAIDYNCPDGRRCPPSGHPRLLAVRSMGLWCRRGKFVVAELTLHKPFNSSNVLADVCFLRSSSYTSSSSELAWSSALVDIPCGGNTDDEHQLRRFQADSVIPFRQWLCWTDYSRGILLCDVSKLPATPTVSFLRLPLDEFPHTKISTSFLYRGASVVDQGCSLKFVNVARNDDLAFGALKPGAGFTITCHTFVLGDGGSMAWEEDYTVTSSQLWRANTLDRLPRGIVPMFPRVDIYRPQVVHFLLIEFGFANKNMWVVSIDMGTKNVESSYQYIDRKEGLQTDDADLIREKSMSPKPFLPCEFPKFLSRFVILLLAAAALSSMQ
ncbi:unnamed protein product [Urochloa decumbens]|uniref:DUF1618 domain-containing protein n=1 Tax=Urochloa decumbens TaxID=240449 RepID=A0ABC8VGS7_9POAL